MTRLYLFMAFVISLMLTSGCCIHNINRVQNDSGYVTNVPEHLNASTVILLRESNGLYRSSCSGVWLNNKDILTARHCVAEDDEEESVKIGKMIKFQTYKEFDMELGALKTEAYNAYILAYDDLGNQDLAIVRTLDYVAHNTVRVHGGEIPISSQIRIVGHPNRLDYTHIIGTVSQIRTGDYPYDGAKLIQVAAEIWFGNSGGGAFTMEGDLIGICSFMIIGKSGFSVDQRVASFFVHRDKIVEFLDNKDISFTY